MSFKDGFAWELSLIGLSLTTFILVNTLTKSEKYQTDWVLCVWLVLLNVPFIHSVLSHLSLSDSGFYRYTNPTLNLLHGPLMYLYVRMLISYKVLTLRISELIHFIPFGLLYVLFLTLFPDKPMMPQPDTTNTEVNRLAENAIAVFFEPLLIHFGFISVALFVGYSIATLCTLKKHQKNIIEVFSQKENEISLRWIYTLPGVFSVLVGLNAVYENFFQSHIYIHPLTLHMLSFLSFVILLCFFGVKQKPVFQPEYLNASPGHLDDNENISIEPNDVKEDNSSSNNVSDEFIAQTAKEIDVYMRREAPYLNSDFSVYTLSKSLGIPRRTLSSVLNRGHSKNFYQYVNDFRIESVKVMLENQDNKSSILDIAMQAGFKSKSSFNSLFKKYCHMTPSQYREMAKQRHDS